ncbi:hypothetical protein [Halobacillus massiliensis]|uniref:hypothetical protein n=1 Tax=Halobacillus massiliensis TaxID=1926286 RepID=UPI001FE7DAFC|nr:hypothetical protein [Halobacillus massiliensis]
MGCRRSNNVGGASKNRRRIAGVSDKGSCNNVAGVSDNNFKVPVKSYIDGEDFCRAVNRCLNNDVMGASENNNNSRRHHKKRGSMWDSWF